MGKEKEEKQDQPTSEEEDGKKKKEKKVKVIYYDDGSTIADMSGTYGNKKPPSQRQKSTFKEKMQTYFAVMKKMVLPLICTLLAFSLVYLFLLIVSGNLS